MENDKQEKKELTYETDNGLNVSVMVEALFTKYMGRILDLARISDMSERTLTQFSRSVKDDCYQHIKFAKTILEKHGFDEKSDK